MQGRLRGCEDSSECAGAGEGEKDGDMKRGMGGDGDVQDMGADLMADNPMKGKVLMLKIALDDIEPKIWRQILVEGSSTFEELHDIIQITMGWENYHLHKFIIGKEEIECDEEGYNLAEASFEKLRKSPEFEKMLEKGGEAGIQLDRDKMQEIIKKEDKKKMKRVHAMESEIGELINQKGQEFSYLYDYGDCWFHSISVEEIRDRQEGERVPSCTGGERACPPEDCGAIDGYEKLVELKKKGKGREYQELIVNWLGEGHDFEFFDPKLANKALDDYSKYGIVLDEGEKPQDLFWEEGHFAETVGPEGREKMKTFHMKHDEDMRFICKKCRKKISAHNKDWHAGLCDRCFNDDVIHGDYKP